MKELPQALEQKNLLLAAESRWAVDLRCLQVAQTKRETTPGKEDSPLNVNSYRL